MTKIYRFKCAKLVRDKSPDTSRINGNYVLTRIMEEEEYLERLKDKLFEETKEVIDACNNANIQDILEELADVLEVIHALGNIHNLSIEQIEEKRITKKQVRGGFDQRIYMDYFEMPSTAPNIDYYLSNQDKYPEEKL